MSIDDVLCAYAIEVAAHLTAPAIAVGLAAYWDEIKPQRGEPFGSVVSLTYVPVLVVGLLSWLHDGGSAAGEWSPYRYIACGLFVFLISMIGGMLAFEDEHRVRFEQAIARARARS
jgi:hypothetical protein